MARRSWREKIENWSIVTVITVLVWLYAEGENVKVYNERIQVRFTAPSGERMAVNPADPVNVFVKFRGSSGQRQRFQLLAAQGPVRLPVTASNQDSAPVERAVVLRDRLAGSALGDIGLNILETEPATKNVDIQPLTDIALPVVVDAGDLELSPSTTITPREVEITLPTNLAQVTRGAHLTARLDQAVDVKNLDVSASYNINVPLTLPPLLRDEDHVKLGRDMVKVSFTIRKVTDTYEPPFLPVRINAPPSVLNHYKVELPQDQQVVRGVKLAGPGDVIARIKRGKFDVWAELRLSSEQVESGVTTVPLFINVPPGVSVTTPQPRAQVKVTPR